MTLLRVGDTEPRIRHPAWVPEPLQVLIGNRDTEHVLITVVRRERPAAEDFWDGNWLVTPIQLCAGRFSGEISADLRTDELRQFREALETLYGQRAGEAVLESMEEWIRLTVAWDSLGALRVEGVASDRPGVGSELRFRLAGLDQSYLPAIIESLREVEHAYPVRSGRDS